MTLERSARERRKNPTSPGLARFTAGFMQMTWKSAVSSTAAASQPLAWAHSHLGEEEEKQKLGVTTASLLRKAHDYLSEAEMF